MNGPLVSAVVAVHNGERYLGQALDSIMAQEYSPVEVIVVDDGSVDGSAEVIGRYAGVRYAHQPKQGNAAPRNRGISLSRGEFVAFLDQDDWWSPSKLRVQVRCLLDDPQAGYCIARRRLFLESGTERPPWLKPELLERDDVAYCPGVLVARRATLERYGAFDERYVATSDVDWFARMNDAGVRMACAGEVLLHKRIHGGNQSSVTRLIHHELAQVLKMGPAPCWSRARRSRAWALSRRNGAWGSSSRGTCGLRSWACGPSCSPS